MSGIADVEVTGTSSEPAAAGDIRIVGGSVDLRAIRDDEGPGRTYTLVATATDRADNTIDQHRDLPGSARPTSIGAHGGAAHTGRSGIPRSAFGVPTEAWIWTNFQPSASRRRAPVIRTETEPSSTAIEPRVSNHPNPSAP